MFIIALTCWCVVYSSAEIFKKFCPSEYKDEVLFLGYWAGLLFPSESKDFISFYSCISGYLLIILFLVIEKKLLEYVDDIENTYQFIDNNDDEILEENKILNNVI